MCVKCEERRQSKNQNIPFYSTRLSRLHATESGLRAALEDTQRPEPKSKCAKPKERGFLPWTPSSWATDITAPQRLGTSRTTCREPSVSSTARQSQLFILSWNESRRVLTLNWNEPHKAQKVSLQKRCVSPASLEL